jgi:hypothetical protein
MMLANHIQYTPKQNRQQTIAELRGRIQAYQQRRQFSPVLLSTGCDALDALFPCRGVRQGSLVEWVEDGVAAGAGTLSLAAGRRFSTAERPTILVDFQRQIYPLALSALGFDLPSLIVVRPRCEQEALWACEQSLRSKAVALVWARIDSLGAVAFRRLQLAAERSGAVGFLVRSVTVLKEPSWADVRLLVTPRPARAESSRFRVTVAYSRGRSVRATADIEIDALRGEIREIAKSQTHRLSLVS